MIRSQANPEERCSLTHGESMALALSLSPETSGFGARGTGNHPVLSYQQTTLNQIDPEGWPMFR
ncbi:MAG: hypothetical protein RIF41_09755 [Polyangiaceae bacterium]